jgi:para-aminobenzoate synthetase component 1
MRVLVEEAATHHSPDSLAASLRGEPGLVLLRTGSFDVPSARYSFVTTRPALTFRSFGSDCLTRFADGRVVAQFGDPWQYLAPLLASFELLDEVDVPFPLGGCFGYWGYDLKGFVEPRLTRRAVNDLELPDCHLGYYPSLVVFDHQLGKTWIVATGLDAEGNRSDTGARNQMAWWRHRLGKEDVGDEAAGVNGSAGVSPAPSRDSTDASPRGQAGRLRYITSSLARAEFLTAVARAQRYICAGDIYQVNLAQRLAAPCPFTGWGYFERLSAASPAPFSAYLDCGDFALVSSSPELFLRLSGGHILTRPIKGTRQRDNDPVRDAQLAWELQRSEKENAELLMITDLLRNDLGRVCEFGSVRVPDLMRLERFAQVQHLVSTVEGRLRDGVTHLDALAACFPGGSITGAPKIRAMEIIDELEPVARGPYCGCHGYLGFNRESELSITIRTAVVRDGTAWFHVGAGIVADSKPEAEYEETLAKAGGLLTALGLNAESKPLISSDPR